MREAMRRLALFLILLPVSCPAIDMEPQVSGWRYATQMLNSYPVRLKSLPIAHFEQKLDEINRQVNAQPYTNDDATYREASYWETPVQFYQVGGECRDYAVAKYHALFALGVADADMMFVAVRPRTGKYRGQLHAILIVKHGGHSYILDNLYSNVRPASAMVDYQPVYFINRISWKSRAMRKPSTLESRLYCCAFLGVLAAGAVLVSYLEGGIDEQGREARDVTAVVAQEQAKADFWQAKYDSLAANSDWLTIADSAATFQGERQ
jgi:predicted transglutaminase-like cysteine proteinase